MLIWCAAAWHLKDRDTLIGWDPVTRSQRLKFVVQLRRFLVPDKARRPNLASQCLALGLREMPAQWLLLHGYRPLMAETFSDPESHAGTVYKATNWTYAGDTQGFSQDHTDYYLPNERPKKLWLKPLEALAVGLLSARSAVKVKREWVERSRPDKERLHIRHFISSLSPEEVVRLGTAVREHWSVENCNHHKRDDSVWQEDRHRFRLRKAGVSR